MEKLQTILFLVRHGATDREYSQDKSDDAERQLTELGRRQARSVGRYLDQFSPPIIYSSPLDRCVETAKLIQAEIASEPVLTTAPELVEVYSSLPKVRQEVGERGESIFSLILDNHRGEQVVAVTHQYIIGYIVADFLGKNYSEIPCDFADVYRLVFANETLIEAIRLQPARV